MRYMENCPPPPPWKIALYPNPNPNQGVICWGGGAVFWRQFYGGQFSVKGEMIPLTTHSVIEVNHSHPKPDIQSF